MNRPKRISEGFVLVLREIDNGFGFIQYDYFKGFTKNGGIINTSFLEYVDIIGNKKAPIFLLEKVKESLKDVLDIYDPHFIRVRTTIEHIEEE